MKTEEKQAVRKEIEQRIADAQKSMVTLREQIKPVPPSVAIGRLTRMDAIQQKSMAEANLRSAENDIKNLKKALLRLDEDNFGVCVVCGGEIPPGRILAVPEAKVCVKCASAKRR
jgi:DnaK suppressor protein